ncbi:hypothetical protein ATK17_3793 [Branchiibius hedensis]|uniref:Uncharacterized protein n=1 Tax=Branchiibius hedensis TaxID=672460 RepID=A0A2Y9BMP5_9MICO|nr:hypothetical protein [Branchiibius hedensis]PWJ23299.1 hypothetical protein ATK17_3793 [Branchiibius hedensis]SSA58988.1 hypothetical protein SAMN04489750_3793 [Branchiibius hedensis]
MSLIEVVVVRVTTRTMTRSITGSTGATAGPPVRTGLALAAAGFIRANAAYRQAYETWRTQRDNRGPGECATSAADRRRDQRHQTLFAAHEDLAAAADAVRRAGGQIDYSPDGGDTVRVYGPGHQLLGYM